MIGNELLQRQCTDCDQTFPGSTMYCNICGSSLKLRDAGSNQENISSRSHDSFHDLFYELIGEDFRQTITDYLALSSPNRMVSKEYLKNISIVELDSTEGILVDSSLQVGPLSLLVVLASFGSQQLTSECAGNLILGEPFFGESAILNTKSCERPLVCLKRGVVSFAQKAAMAQQGGAAALIVIQTGANWPFVMTDSANELDLLFHTKITIPVVMIGPDDGKVIEDIIGKNRSTNVSNIGVPAVLKFGPSERLCSVCHEYFVCKDKLIKLNCRHVYHADCLKTWLGAHSTCPLCRHQLPKATVSEVAAAHPRMQTPSLSSALPYFT